MNITYVFLEEIREHTVRHMQCEHESVGLEEWTTYILIHKLLQWTVQHLYPVFWTCTILEVVWHTKSIVIPMECKNEIMPVEFKNILDLKVSNVFTQHQCSDWIYSSTVCAVFHVTWELKKRSWLIKVDLASLVPSALWKSLRKAARLNLYMLLILHRSHITKYKRLPFSARGSYAERS